MRVVIFTTETPHHVYLVREVAQAFPDTHVLDEQRRVTPPFPTHHTFEDERDAFECARWFSGVVPYLARVAPTTVVGSVNDAAAGVALDLLHPDVVLAAGVGKIAPHVIARFSGRIVNLHGGDPESYRGLDSHLWAIYHRDFPALVATLHHLTEQFDDGAIIQRAAVTLRRSMPLSELRAANTETCAQLALSGLDHFERSGRFATHPQRASGRYYSSMPSVLKELCVERFARYTAMREATEPLHAVVPSSP